MSEDTNTRTIYEQIGGEATVKALVDRFYELMDTLPEAVHVRAAHGPSLAHANDMLYKYLTGWLGGPPLYVQEKGHPRLRMRHFPFHVGPQERDEWMLCMRQSLSEHVGDEQIRAGITRALQGLADHMVNR